MSSASSSLGSDVYQVGSSSTLQISSRISLEIWDTKYLFLFTNEENTSHTQIITSRAAPHISSSQSLLDVTSEHSAEQRETATFLNNFGQEIISSEMEFNALTIWTLSFEEIMGF